jgi:hypothetical protein
MNEINSSVIDIIVFVYNSIKGLFRLASERYFLTLEIQLDINNSDETLTRLFPLKTKSKNSSSDEPGQLIQSRIYTPVRQEQAYHGAKSSSPWVHSLASAAVSRVVAVPAHGA